MIYLGGLPKSKRQYWRLSGGKGKEQSGTWVVCTETEQTEKLTRLLNAKDNRALIKDEEEEVEKDGVGVRSCRN